MNGQTQKNSFVTVYEYTRFAYGKYCWIQEMNGMTQLRLMYCSFLNLENPKNLENWATLLYNLLYVHLFETWFTLNLWNCIMHICITRLNFKNIKKVLATYFKMINANLIAFMWCFCCRFILEIWKGCMGITKMLRLQLKTIILNNLGK